MQFRQNYYLTVFVISRINAIEFIFSYLFDSYLLNRSKWPANWQFFRTNGHIRWPTVILSPFNWDVTKQLFYSMETP